MSATLQDGILNELGDEGVQQIAGLLGTDTETARQAVNGALPALVGGLAANTQTQQGAESLYSALGDHTQPVQDVAALSGGDAILGHVLGDKADPVAQAVGDRTGISPDLIKKAAVVLAPIVLSYLSKRFLNGQQSGPGQVAEELQNEKPSGGLGDLLGQILGGFGK